MRFIRFLSAVGVDLLITLYILFRDRPRGGGQWHASSFLFQPRDTQCAITRAPPDQWTGRIKSARGIPDTRAHVTVKYGLDLPSAGSTHAPTQREIDRDTSPRILVSLAGTTHYLDTCDFKEIRLDHFDGWRIPREELPRGFIFIKSLIRFLY